MRTVLKDRDLQSAFAKDGFIKSTLITPSQVSDALDVMENLRPNDQFLFRRGPNGLEVTYHCSFLDSSIEYKREADRVLRQLFQSHIDRVLADFRIFTCNFYVKPAHAGELPLHQNWPSTPNMMDTTVTVWVPLVDVSMANGALQLGRGTQKLLPHVEGPANPGYFTPFRQAVVDKYLESMSMVAGQALIFDDGLLHYSPKNVTDQPRIAVQISCVPKDIQPVFYFYDPAHPDRFELIEADDEFFLRYSYQDLLVRQPEWKSLGYAPNRNQLLSEEEFLTLWRNGDQVRQQAYAAHAASAA